MDVHTSNPAPGRDYLRPLRYLWRVPLLLALIVLGSVLCLIVFSISGDVAKDGHEPLAHRTIRWWSKALLRAFGFRARYRGQALPDPVLLVCNHSAWLDIELMHTQRAACFVAKAEIARWPLVGWMARRGGTIFHRRGSNHSLTAVMQVMTERLREGRSVAVFPEGGTNDGVHLRVFHARILQAALDAQVPVQPVALRYARGGKHCGAVAFRPGENFMGNVLRLMGEPPLDAEVHFLEPVVAGEGGRRRMAETARARIGAVLDSGA